MIQPNDVITDGTVEWTVRDIRGGTDGNPVGTILAFAGNETLPDGYLLCDGAAVSRTDYADLFAVIGTIYGEGDGADTFSLPDLIDKFVQGAATAGTVKAAGLPNITGSFGNATSESYFGSGAFNVSSATADRAYGSGAKAVAWDFNANRSSDIYGASATVQPPAVTVKYIIKY